jgi:hypothetical protein
LAILILLTHCSWLVGTSGVLTSILNSIFHLSPENVSRLAQAITPIENDPIVHQLTGLGRPITLSYLPMFFALSGFLVTGSALRTRRLIPFQVSTIGLASRPVSLFARQWRSAAAIRFANRYVMRRQMVTSQATEED